MAEGYFYFPGPLIMPMLLELIGFDPIMGVTIFVLIFDIFSLFAFYLLVLKFFDHKVAFNAFLFYSFLLDILLNLAVFGVFPHATSTFYLILLFIIAYEVFFEKNKDYTFITLMFIGLFSFHLYSGFIFLTLIFALITYEISTKKINRIKHLIKTFIIAGFFSLILVSPFFIKFSPYFGLNFEKDYIADLMVFSYGRSSLPLNEKIIGILFASPTGLRSTVVSFLGFIASLFAIKKMIKTKAIVLLIFLVYCTLFSYFVFDDYNLFRNLFGNWIVYTIAFALVLEDPRINILFFTIFIFVQSQSPLFLITHLVPMENPAVPWVIWPEFFDTMKFIEENVSQDATFLIDGGGAGCTGANPSYGERIFPSTSRKIFYFTDYCWSLYDKQDYQKRVDIYRSISINPDDEDALDGLKFYNVTHVYIGKYHVGLNPRLFQKSYHYELIFKKGGDYVFEIL